MVDIIDELRQTAGNLINGVIDDGEVPVSMLTEAADEIERLRGVAQVANDPTYAEKISRAVDRVTPRCTWPDCDQPSGHDFCYKHCLGNARHPAFRSIPPADGGVK